jgi:hypothetical protein
VILRRKTREREREREREEMDNKGQVCAGSEGKVAMESKGIEKRKKEK